MDISKLLVKYYINNAWSCGDTYESIEWNDTTEPKPSEEELNLKWEELKKEHMRQKRNQLLKDSDFRVLPDYPHTNKEAWVLYREQLRALPETWVEGTPFPSMPE